jgi:hypothetical protein
VRTEVSVQYVDHNLLQIDNLNADDHLFLESACRRFGIWYSRPGKPGEKIFVPGAKKLDDGSLEAPNISFGDYGVWR